MEKKAKETTTDEKELTEEETSKTDKKPKINKKFYKKAWFWLVVVGGLALAGLAIFLAIFYSAQSKNKQVVKSGWSDMVSQSICPPFSKPFNKSDVT